jgi:uncharacterized delta-60 repeat protein
MPILVPAPAIAHRLPAWREQIWHGLRCFVCALWWLVAALMPPPAAALTLADSFNPGADSFVTYLALQPDGKVLMAGAFDTVAGQPRSRIARLHEDGTLDTGFNATFDGTVWSMALQPDGKVLVGGNFITVSGQPHSRVARLLPDGSLDASFSAGLGANGTITDLALQPDGKVLVVGDFTTMVGQPRQHIARLHSDGTLDSTFDPGTGANNTIYRLTLAPDGKLLVGGFFSSVSGHPTGYLARLNADGSVDTSFVSGVSNYVARIAVQPDGRLVVGGDFAFVHGVPRTHLARLESDGMLDISFDPISGGSVRAIAVQPDGKLIVGGFFSDLGGMPQGKIGRLNPDGSADATFDTGSGVTGSGVFHLAVQPDGKIVIGGSFNSVGGAPRLQVARLSTTADTPTGLAAAVSGPASVHLTWAAPARNGGSPVTGYTVTGSPAGSCTSTGALECTVAGLAPGVAHTFTVTATNAAGTSSPSGPASATPAMVPGAPTGLVAVAGSASAALSWTAPTSNGGSPISGYTVTGVPAGSCTTAGATSCTISGLANGVPHSFTVTATSAAGTGSPSSAASATPIGAPGAPTGLSAVVGDGAVLLSWAAPTSDGGSPVTGYVVTGIPGGHCTTTGALSCLVSGLVNGVVHSFTVAAANAVGTGSPSGATLATPALWRQPSLPLPGGGAAAVTIGAPPGCAIAGAQISTSVPPGAPVGAAFPLGVFSFSATGAGCAHTTLPVQLTYPAGSLAGLQPHKYGPAAGGAAASWFAHGTVAGDSVSYAVTDNGVGDSDTQPAAIADPFAPVRLATAPAAIPTLGGWGLVLLPLLACALGLARLRGPYRNCPMWQGRL